MQNEVSGEFGLIKKIKESFKDLIPGGMEGIGDDAAVIPCGNGESLVVTTDMLVENVHFLRNAISPRELGAKSLSVNLSDVAAMGAAPVASFLSIGLPKDVSDAWRVEFIEGYRSVSYEYSTPLLGGDTTLSEAGIVINVAVIGKAPEGNLKFRSGAQAGDAIYLTGNIGDSGAGLKILVGGGSVNDEESGLIKAHHNPRPYVREGEWLGRQKAVTSMIDISDGVASDLGHILELSGVGAKVDTGKVPMSKELRSVASSRGWSAEEIALTGGEDYVLLFTVSKDGAGTLKKEFKDVFGFEITELGEITAAGDKIEWHRDGKSLMLNFKGFTHF